MWRSDLSGLPLVNPCRLGSLTSIFQEQTIPYMKRNSVQITRFSGLLVAAVAFALDVAAQPSTAQQEREFIEGSGNALWYTVAFLVVAVLGLAFYLWRKSKKGSDQVQHSYANRYRANNNNDSYDMEGLDAEKELEWLRKAKKSTSTPKITYGPKSSSEAKKGPSGAGTVSIDGLTVDTKEFQEKMRKLQYAQLPINSFGEVNPSKKYDVLPVSEDPSLLNAIEQANDEYEEDESVRDLSVRILAAFRTRNSVEALAQIALYDLSSNLRSKAVSILTDFDHESVFESILLACADPTREVRAAAARGLFRLNFDRADAWKRIVETADEFRMRHAARAAIEAGIVSKAFERLVHEDLKISYEAFVLVALMIKSGETEEIFEAIKSHKDERVKYALLHVLRVVSDERSLNGLNNLRNEHTFATDLSERIVDTIKSFEQVAV